MTRLTALMFVAAIAIWGLASIPDGGIGDRASSAYQRVELGRTTDRAFLAATHTSATSIQPAVTLAAVSLNP
jgi:hypothetical protein